MQVVVTLKNGKRYRFDAAQSVVYTDDGTPAAVTYEHGGLIAHSDVANHQDFDQTCRNLCIERLRDG